VTYFIFGAFNAVAALHIIFMFPETAGRTLEEVEEVFAQGHWFTAWKISKDVGKKTLADVIGKDVDVRLFTAHLLPRHLN
jgi:Sugar (and other) transporter